MIFVSSGSRGVALSFSTFVGNASNLQDLVGIDIMIFSTSSSVRLVKFSRDLLLLCWVGLNFGPVSSASLIFLILFIKMQQTPQPTPHIPRGSRGFDLFLPVIISMSLNSFLVSLPPSMICEDSICVFDLLIMAMYFFLSSFSAVH